MSLSGKVIRKPVVREKVIFSTIESDDKEYQIVCFRKYRPQKVVDAISSLSVGDEINLIGKLEINEYTDEQQFIVDDIETKSNESEEEGRDWTYNAAHSERWLEEDPKYSRQTYDPKLDTWIPDYF